MDTKMRSPDYCINNGMGCPGVGKKCPCVTCIYKSNGDQCGCNYDYDHNNIVGSNWEYAKEDNIHIDCKTYINDWVSSLKWKDHIF